jgi:hypothetical protein
VRDEALDIGFLDLVHGLRAVVSFDVRSEEIHCGRVDGDCRRALLFSARRDRFQLSRKSRIFAEGLAERFGMTSSYRVSERCARLSAQKIETAKSPETRI